tara:strand:- start:4558 stop:5061 length:504 start_codon:yes stop_codon:yes gene_type:complete
MFQLEQSLRLVKIALLISCAIFMTLIAVTNIFIYDVNFEYIKHVMSMDTTFQHPKYLSRAIVSPFWHHACYIFTIFCESLASLFCWIGVFQTLKYFFSDIDTFEKSKQWGILGLSFSVLIYVFLFFVIGNEWFASWQSKTWNAKQAVLPILVVLGICLIYFKQSDRV